MNIDGIFRRRRMPHWDVDGKPYFVTGCLEGSLASKGLERIHAFREDLERRPCPEAMSQDDWEHKKHSLLFGFVDKLLDHESPVHSLDDPEQAEVVFNAFLHFADERYELFAFVVMPSHHHWVFLPNEYWSAKILQENRSKKGIVRTPREIICHSVQSYTGTMCNRVRETSGSYWQQETFDHWVRDEAELIRIINYIENNPVSAGLVARPEEWKWSSARLRRERGIALGQPIR